MEIKKKMINNWEFPREKGGRNKHSKIWGGKKKQFLTKYSPLEKKKKTKEGSTCFRRG